MTQDKGGKEPLERLEQLEPLEPERSDNGTERSDQYWLDLRVPP